MTFAETRDFLVEIVGIYPKFKVMDGTVKAWADRLTACTPEKAKELLDKWITGDDSMYPPQLDYFVKGQNPVKVGKAFWSDEPIIYHVGTGLLRGTLLDQYEREYGDPDALGDYRQDQFGRIFDCNDHLIQWIDERGAIHNGRGVFTPEDFKREEERRIEAQNT